eukprot:5470024-Prymnesium_polylepis.1
MTLYLRISSTAASGEATFTCSGTPGRPLYTRPVVGFVRCFVIDSVRSWQQCTSRGTDRRRE